MSQPVTISGASIFLYINNKLYTTVQSITYKIDYTEEGIYGIDTPWAQEISGNKAYVRGTVRGLRVKMSGGLQGSNIRPAFTDLAMSPYISIRVQDRTTSEDIILITNAKCSNEEHTAAIKGSYKLNFDFVGQIPLFALDRA